MAAGTGIALGQESEENTSTPAPEAGTEDQSLVYRDSEYGVIISYPADWELVERDAGSIAVFFSPAAALPENENLPIGHLALYVDRRAGVADLFSYNDTIAAEYEDQLEGFRILGMESRTLAGGEAQQMKFDATDATGTFRALDVWTLRNDVVYHAVFYSPPDDFEVDLSTVTAMLDSLQIIQASIDRPILGGDYELPSLGLQIQLPGDWAGYVIHEGNSTFTFLSPAEIQQNLGGGNSGNFAVMFIYADPDERFEVQREWTAYGCEPPNNASLVTVNQVKAVESRVQCTDPQISQLSVYGFASTDDGFYIGFGTSSQEAYETYLSDFEESLNTVEFSDPGDLADLVKYARIGAMESTAHPVFIGEKAYDLYFASTAPVASVVLDQAQNQLTFETEKGLDSAGEVYFRVSYFLHGPYVVTVDGQVTENGVELVRDGDAYYLSIRYDSSQEHAVTVTGTKVVPEFGTILSVLLPLLLAGTVIVSRIKLANRELARLQR